MMTDYTIDELICVCISRQVEDGEPLAQGIATPLVMAGYLLAKLTHHLRRVGSPVHRPHRGHLAGPGRCSD
jgi:hypothetical protein